MLVRKADVLAAGFCGPGMKAWCRQHGIDSRQINDGVPAELLLATGCALAEAVVAKARERQVLEADDVHR
ncbi:hypothetical protein IQ03_03508 [Gemmobacter caeni]|uniref:Uncharacterized protein n=1 Tax=Gemmobacter caeni TaxID=589035 RepID=A0A2T6AT47_9RHOB|nr:MULTISPECIES: hypothetical protein [Paracoccaceae]PTX46995.1 hypothetical protein C8N34_11415 [Gemmobacter caeni]RDD72913.1 hypothetical protein DVR11_03025 [Paracoccus versutus]TWI96148.1 hypothetical protein IQ03_03508 [Gemmobacter caeni]